MLIRIGKGTTLLISPEFHSGLPYFHFLPSSGSLRLKLLNCASSVWGSRAEALHGIHFCRGHHTLCRLGCHGVRDKLTLAHLGTGPPLLRPTASQVQASKAGSIGSWCLLPVLQPTLLPLCSFTAPLLLLSRDQWAGCTAWWLGSHANRHSVILATVGHL